LSAPNLQTFEKRQQKKQAFACFYCF